jgi:serine/threonine protein kinase/Tfp pilus assembly protein PilF
MEANIKFVSHYEILGPLGVGGMGIVYKARDLHLDRLVAIKFLPSQFETSKTRKDRFVREAKAASALDHPNICTIFEIGSVADGQMFIAMAYYDGETLKQIIDRGPLGVPESIEIAVQVAQGLVKAHAKGIIHRDIKPANLIITKDRVVKILDFGLAKLRGSRASDSGTLVGTLAYMSPEQIAGETDQRTDLWSLGVVLYEMLTGQTPFHADREKTTIDQIFHREPRRLTDLRADVPLAVERLVVRALQKESARRYQSAEELLRDLRRAHKRSSLELLSTAELSDKQTSRTAPSIAVLPFLNLTHEPEAEYFSDGLAEDMIYALSQIEGLHVVSRVSAFEFKGKSQNLAEIAERLNVALVLDGSVRLSGEHLRVTVEMTNTADGYCLWSKRFDREMKDVFAIQDEIASGVVSILKLRFASRSPASLTQRYVGHPEAYKLYLKGRYWFNKNSEEGFRKAGECFGQAIGVDPGCAPAYAGLADFYLALGFWSVIAPREAWPEAREYAKKAMLLDAKLPEPHITMAKIYQFADWNRQAADEEFRQTLQLNPGHSDSHFAYSIFLLQTALMDHALEEIKRAHDLDPLNLSVATGVGWLYYYLGDYSRAMEECRQVLELCPEYPEAQSCMALCSEKTGRLADHVAWFEKAAATSAELPFVLGLLGRAYALNGQDDKARELQAKLRTMSETRNTSQVAHALVSLGLGELDRAMQWLEEAFRAQDAFLCYARVFPPFDPLRKMLRFQEMLYRMGVAGSGTGETTADLEHQAPMFGT